LHERAIEASLAVAIFLTACGSSAVEALQRFGGTARWVGLLAFGAIAVSWAMRNSLARMRLPRSWLLALAFVTLATVSVAWSVAGWLTLGRVTTLGLVFAAAAALAVVDVDRSSAAAFRAILAGAALVAFAGLVVWILDPDAAVQQADTAGGWRFRGLGQNPNTSSMLYAVALPLAVWLATRPERRNRAAGAALTVLFACSIAVSGSRGALAGFLGAIAAAVLLPRTRRARLALGVAMVALFGVSGLISKLPEPLSIEEYFAANPRPPQPLTRGIDLQQVIRLEDEIGRPPGGRFEEPIERRFFSFGPRGEGWELGIDVGRKRPVTGYGFGTEDRVFVDRSSDFQGGLPESSYVGAFIQLGLVGAALFVAVLLSCAADAVRVLRRSTGEPRRQGIAAAAVLLVAILLGLGQSSLYSVGNIATLSIWVCVLALPALAAGGRRA
jgi:hypothetical protein